MAPAREIKKRGFHALEGLGLAAEIIRPGKGQSFDVRAGSLSILPKLQQGTNILDRKAQVACMSNES